MLFILLQLESKLLNQRVQDPAWQGLGPGPNQIWTRTVQNACLVCCLRGFNSMCRQPRKRQESTSRKTGVVSNPIDPDSKLSYPLEQYPLLDLLARLFRSNCSLTSPQAYTGQGSVPYNTASDHSPLSLWDPTSSMIGTSCHWESSRSSDKSRLQFTTDLLFHSVLR